MRLGPHNHILQFIHRVRRHEVRGLDSWEVVKEATKDIDVHGEFFNIPLDLPARHKGMIPLKYFSNVHAIPFLYDRFNGSWGKFPNLDQIVVYFSEHL